MACTARSHTSPTTSTRDWRPRSRTSPRGIFLRLAEPGCRDRRRQAARAARRARGRRRARRGAHRPGGPPPRRHERRHRRGRARGAAPRVAAPARLARRGSGGTPRAPRAGERCAGVGRRRARRRPLVPWITTRGRTRRRRRAPHRGQPGRTRLPHCVASAGGVRAPFGAPDRDPLPAFHGRARGAPRRRRGGGRVVTRRAIARRRQRGARREASGGVLRKLPRDPSALVDRDDQDPDLALLLAVEARRLHPAVDTDGAVESALVTGLAGVEAAITLEPRAQPYANLSPDGRLVAVAGVDGFVRLLDVDTGLVLRRLSGPQITAPVDPMFNRDGTLLAVGSDEGKIRVWNVATGRQVVRPLATQGGGSAYGVFDPAHEQQLLTAGHDGTVSRWDLRAATPRPTDPFTVPAATTQYPLLFMLSPDGKRLIVGDPGVGPTSAWDVDSRTMLSLVPGSPGSFGADGETFVTSDDGQVKVWNVLTGALVSASGNSFTIDYGSMVALSADGRLAAVQEARTLRVHVIDVETGADVIPPISRQKSGSIQRFLPDGRLFIASADRMFIVRVDNAVAPVGRVLVGSHTTGARVDSPVTPIVSSRSTSSTARASGTPAAARCSTTLESPGDPSSAVIPSPDLRTALLVQRRRHPTARRHPTRTAGRRPAHPRRRARRDRMEPGQLDARNRVRQLHDPLAHRRLRLSAENRAGAQLRRGRYRSVMAYVGRLQSRQPARRGRAGARRGGDDVRRRYRSPAPRVPAHAGPDDERRRLQPRRAHPRRRRSRTPGHARADGRVVFFDTDTGTKRRHH